jgi:hypothetical protein
MHSHARTSAKTDATLVLSRTLLPLILSPETARQSSQKKLNRGFETLSAPSSLAATLRGLTFYLAVPITSIQG